jgi:hypothetical protein
MRLQLAENGFSQATPQAASPLDKAAQIINSIQAVKNIPFVGQALQIANGIVGVFDAKEKAALAGDIKKARNVDVVNWWTAEGNAGSPWEPMTQAKAEWLVSRLGAAVQTVSQELIGLKKGTGAVSKARWVKAYQTLLDEVMASQKKVTAGPGLIPGVPAKVTGYLPWILGGAAVLFFLMRRKK